MLFLNMISLEYDDTCRAAPGTTLEEHLEKNHQRKKPVNISWLLKVAYHLDEDGVYCTVGGRTFRESLLEAAKGAASNHRIWFLCSWGGIWRQNQIQQIQFPCIFRCIWQAN